MRQGVRLEGWKQIASHLNISLRSAQYAESEGLPVYRYTDKPRSQVWAFTDEIDAWQQARIASAERPGSEAFPPHEAPAATEAPSPVPVLPVRTLRFWAGVAACLIVLSAFTALTAHRLIPKGPPASVAVVGRKLIATNEQGQPLWDYPLPDHVHTESYGPHSFADFVWIGDLDRDGSTEVLFVYRPVSDLQLGTPLFCFSETGELKWQFRGGRKVHYKDELMSDIYFSDVTVLPQIQRIVVRSNHSKNDPQQVAILDASGRMLAEHWHPGHLRHLIAIDSAQGPELLLPGVNNEAERATLVVLPVAAIPPVISAKQPANLLELARRGGESATVLFPRSCITRKLEAFNRAYRVEALADRIEVDVYESHTESGNPPYLSYVFNRNLDLEAIEVSSTFRSRHKQLEAEGKLDHPFSDAEREQWKRELLVQRHGARR